MKRVSWLMMSILLLSFASSELQDYFSPSEGRYTNEFFLFWGLALVALIIVVVFIIYFFKRPNAPWKKQDEEVAKEHVPFHRRFMMRKAVRV